MGDAPETESRGEPVAEEKAGSTTVLIYHAPVTKTVTVKDKDGATREETRTYESYSISYYEGCRLDVKRILTDLSDRPNP